MKKYIFGIIIIFTMIFSAFNVHAITNDEFKSALKYLENPKATDKTLTEEELKDIIIFYFVPQKPKNLELEWQEGNTNIIFKPSMQHQQRICRSIPLLMNMIALKGVIKTGIK